MELAAGLGACAFGLRLRDHLSSENLLLDTLDRLQLRERSLQAWHDRARAMPAQQDLVVSLTTLPSRIGWLGPTLASLFAQSLRPRAILLHVPSYSRRERRGFELPTWLAALTSVHVVPCEDQGPATKLLPALRSEASDTRIVVVDDDHIYPKRLLEWLSSASALHPNSAVGAAGWRVPGDLTDRPTTLLRNLRLSPPTPITAPRIERPARVDILQGRAGYLVRPRFFDTQAVHDYTGAPEAAFFVDDVWLSAHCTAPKYVVPMPRFGFAPLHSRAVHRRTAVSLHSRGGGDPELRHNTLLIRHFEERWRHDRS